MQSISTGAVEHFEIWHDETNTYILYSNEIIQSTKNENMFEFVMKHEHEKTM